MKLSDRLTLLWISCGICKLSQKTTKRMPRSAVPSQAQQDMLLDLLQEKRWLATGYARTSNARDRTRAAWEEIALKLNSDGRGCIKSWQQWAKYWKDKKSAVKKKYSQIRMERQRTGGGAAEEIVLSPIEERIVALMGGERFATGDRELEINPFHQSNNEPDPLPVAPPQEIQEVVELNIEEIRPDSDATASESILQAYIHSIAVEPGTSRSNFDDLAVVGHSEAQMPSIVMNIDHPGRSLQEPQQSSPIRHREGDPHQSTRGSQMTQRRVSGTERAREASAAASATSSPHRRRLVRRRVIRRSPPAQRQSQLRTLTERFIAIEEQRVETERMLAQNQKDYLAVFKKISEDFHELVEHIKKS